jgi:ATP-dependent protease ClpP protease subunit
VNGTNHQGRCRQANKAYPTRDIINTEETISTQGEQNMKKLVCVCLITFLAACASAPAPPISTPQEVVLKVIPDEVKTVQVVTEEKEKPQPIHEKLSDYTFIAGNKAFISIWGGIGGFEAKNAWKDFVILKEDTAVRDVCIYMNSGGGSVSDSMAILEQIEKAKIAGFTVDIHVSGMIASAAIPILAVCDERVASPGTLFMVHPSSIGKMFAREELKDLRAQEQMMMLSEAAYLEKMERYTKISGQEWKRLGEQITWFDAKQAKEWGLIDRIE